MPDSPLLSLPEAGADLSLAWAPGTEQRYSSLK